MAPIQGLVSTLPAQINISRAHQRVREILRPRSQLLLRVLAGGYLNVTEIEFQMYHAGDTTITQDQVSRTIAEMLRARVIKRVYPVDKSNRLHYYALHTSEIRRINAALHRFIAPPKVEGST